jgi:hypothetical protein
MDKILYRGETEGIYDHVKMLDFFRGRDDSASLGSGTISGAPSNGGSLEDGYFDMFWVGPSNNGAIFVYKRTASSGYSWCELRAKGDDEIVKRVETELGVRNAEYIERTERLRDTLVRRLREQRKE